MVKSIDTIYVSKNRPLPTVPEARVYIFKTVTLNCSQDLNEVPAP